MVRRLRRGDRARGPGLPWWRPALSVAAPGLLLALSACGGDPAPRPAPSERGPGIVQTGRTEHSVRAGETIAAIARRYGVEPNALLRANPGVDPGRLEVGRVLRIPLEKPEVRRVQTRPQ